MNNNTIKLGIGFATGRKSFKKVLSSYIYSWNESGIRDKLQANISLSLFVAYDVGYSNTQSTDYTNLNQEMVDAFKEIVFLGSKNAQRSVQQLIDDGGLTAADAKLLFGAGYAGKRNAIVYAALEHGMDYLLFLDDDEYPVAVTKTRDSCLWGGQYVLPVHLQNIKNADITNGYHCGYISPIPQMRFNELMTELDFSRFIEAISNDIVNWTSVKRIQQNGGITYADIPVLLSTEAVPVTEVNHCKFISGSNLCINLTAPDRTFAFFNPPGARGEDTFLSTMLSDRVVTRVPCYTFHDGFSAYHHLLDGVLPLHLEPVLPDSNAVVTRFYNACVGWIRYKPLLLYVTDPDAYESTIAAMKRTLEEILPKLCAFFDRPEFMNLSTELSKYSKSVPKHYQQFLQIQTAWMALLKEKKYWHSS